MTNKTEHEKAGGAPEYNLIEIHSQCKYVEPPWQRGNQNMTSTESLNTHSCWHFFPCLGTAKN